MSTFPCAPGVSNDLMTLLYACRPILLRTKNTNCLIPNTSCRNLSLPTGKYCITGEVHMAPLVITCHGKRSAELIPLW